MVTVGKEQCDDRKVEVDKELKKHEDWLLRHDGDIKDINGDITDIKVASGIQNEAIQNLNKSIRNLSSTIKWGIGIGVTLCGLLISLIFQLINLLT